MIKIYAIRDRLIDYFMQPFVAPEDKPVLASVARLINQGEITSDIAQAPHHFEVWALGHITEEGHIVANKELLADCASLVRTGIRRQPVRTGGGEETATSEISRHRATEDLTGGNGADPSPVQGQTPATPGSRAQAYKAASRGD